MGALRRQKALRVLYLSRSSVPSQVPGPLPSTRGSFLNLPALLQITPASLTGLCSLHSPQPEATKLACRSLSPADSSAFFRRQTQSFRETPPHTPVPAGWGQPALSSGGRLSSQASSTGSLHLGAWHSVLGGSASACVRGDNSSEDGHAPGQVPGHLIRSHPTPEVHVPHSPSASSLGRAHGDGQLMGALGRTSPGHSPARCAKHSARAFRVEMALGVFSMTAMHCLAPKHCPETAPLEFQHEGKS